MKRPLAVLLLFLLSCKSTAGDPVECSEYHDSMALKMAGLSLKPVRSYQWQACSDGKIRDMSCYINDRDTHTCDCTRGVASDAGAELSRTVTLDPKSASSDKSFEISGALPRGGADLRTIANERCGWKIAKSP